MNATEAVHPPPVCCEWQLIAESHECRPAAAVGATLGAGLSKWLNQPAIAILKS